MTTDTVEESVELALSGGCTIVQLREKNGTAQEFYQTAVSLRQVTRRYRVPLIINDRVDIMIAADADGVHVGQSDLPAGRIRQIIGKDKLLGVSVSTAEEARKAVRDGADYLGVGAMFSTSTKQDAGLVTMEELAQIRRAVEVPLVVIGGINEQTVSLFRGTGIDGIAVVSAIVAQEDVSGAAARLKQLVGSLGRPEM